jgi:hypothetical protein
MQRRRHATNLQRTAVRAADQGTRRLAVEILARLEPAFEAMLVLTGKVENNHREPGQKACGEGVVPGAGIEPAQPQGREILSLLCLPISPSGRCKQLYLPRNERKGKCVTHFPFDIWSGRRVSNSRPIPWQGIALPTELLPLGSISGAARHVGKTRRESKDSRPPARRIIRMPVGAVNSLSLVSSLFKPLFFGTALRRGPAR